VREDCDRFRVVALLRPDGELSGLERELHRAHAARCADCRAYAAEVARITACIRTTPPQRLQRRVVVRGRSLRTPALRALAALAIGAVIAAGLGESQRRGATAAPDAPASTAGGLLKAI
jgi:predicted anti-sigma-YlaC factor YlaD